MVVDAEFDDQGRLTALRTVAGGSAGGEQAAQAFAAAQATASKVAAEFQSKGLPMILEYARKVGYPTLGALGVIILGWFFLPAISMNMGFLGKNSVTFYQGLKLLNASGIEGLAALTGGGSAGFYGLLCWGLLVRRVAAAGVARPARHLRPGSAAGADGGGRGHCLFQVSGTILRRVPPRGGDYQRMAQQMAQQAAAQMRSAISIGFGAWLSLLGALYLAWQALKGVAAARVGAAPLGTR